MKYYFILASENFFLNDEPFEEVLRERSHYCFTENKPNDFFCTITSFLLKIIRIVSQSKNESNLFFIQKINYVKFEIWKTSTLRCYFFETAIKYAIYTFFVGTVGLLELWENQDT